MTNKTPRVKETGGRVKSILIIEYVSKKKG